MTRLNLHPPYQHPYNPTNPAANIPAAPPITIAIFVGSGIVPAIPDVELEVALVGMIRVSEGLVVGATPKVSKLTSPKRSSLLKV
jgi:hypothetical protein